MVKSKKDWSLTFLGTRLQCIIKAQTNTETETKVLRVFLEFFSWDIFHQSITNVQRYLFLYSEIVFFNFTFNSFISNVDQFEFDTLLFNVFGNKINTWFVA